jgi:predicted PurR-regulated permease PerM
LKPIYAEYIFLLGTIIVLILPIVICSLIVKNQWNSILNFIIQYSHSIAILGQKLNEYTGIEIINAELIKTSTLNITLYLPKVFNSSLQILVDLGVMYLVLFFFIKDKASILKGVFSLLPLQDTNRTN